MSVINRVWDTQNGPGFVSWKMVLPDTGGLQYPGPGTFGVHTSDYCVEGVVENEQSFILPAQHSLVAPVGTVQALWQMDGDMLDATANGIDLSGNANPLYAPAPASGTKGAYMSNLTWDNVWISQTGSSGPIKLLTAMTLEVLVFPTQTSADIYGRICSMQNIGVGAVNNTLWHLALRTDMGLDNELFYGHEYSTGGAFNEELNTGVAVPLNQWSHIAFTRDAAGTLLRLYINGLLVGRRVAANAPSGGSSSHVQIGTDEWSGGTRRYHGSISSLRYTDAELRPEHILASARATLPPSVRP